MNIAKRLTNSKYKVSVLINVLKRNYSLSNFSLYI